METKKNSFEQGALILIVTGIISKTMGALYRIPLTNILGVEGIGMYQIVLSFLLLALALSSNYIPATMSKCIGFLSSKDNKVATNRIFKAQIVLCLFSTLLISAFLLIFAKQIANFQDKSEIYLSYFILIPTIILSGIKSIYKGIFLGNRKMIIPSVSQLLEEIFKVAVSLTFAYYGAKTSTIAAVNGALIGLIAGEIAGVVFFFIYKKINFKNTGTNNNFVIMDLKLLSSQSFPIMISSIVFPIVTFIDSLLIVKLLILNGNSAQSAISQYGLLQGPTYSLIHLPIMIATSIALAVVPVLSSLFSNKSVKTIKEKSSESIKICLLLVIPAALGLLVLIRPIMQALYPKIDNESIDLCINMFALSSINIVLLSLYEIFSSIMQGINLSSFVMKTIIFCTIIKLISEIILVHFWGIFGAIASNILMYVLAVCICSIKYRALLGSNKDLISKITKIIFASLIMAIAVYFSTKISTNNILTITIGILTGITIYLFLIVFIKIYSISEISKTLFNSQKYKS